jgi:hypothetical protein
MIVLVADGVGICARRARLWDQVIARLRGPHLDRVLADGGSPDSSVLLSLRAQMLGRPSERRVLANSLRRVLATAGSARARLKVPISRSVLRDVAHEVEALADRLASPGPLSVQGIAKARMLLADGTGTFYRPFAASALRAEICNAIQALEPASPWIG